LPNSGDAGADGVSGPAGGFINSGSDSGAALDMNNVPTAPDVARPIRSILAHQPKVAYAGQNWSDRHRECDASS